MFTFEKFNFKTQSALPLPSGELTEKQGYLVSWNGLTAELSPLTSMNGEKLDECLQELLTYQEKWVDLPSEMNLEKPFFGLDLPQPQNNTVLFCLESLLLLKAIGNNDVSVQINSMGSLIDRERIEKEISNGLKCLKFKIGKNDELSEKEFLESLPQTLSLRLDANQKLQRPVANYYKSLHIDYLEEPFMYVSDYQNFELPFALDENRSKWREVFNSNLKAIVVKPSLEYSLSGTFQLAKEAQEKKIQIIVSSAYETPFGLKALLYLASKLDDKYEKAIHGLAGLNWYEAPNNGLKMDAQILFCCN
jgi:O-succinylbenzoate synthase